MVRIKTLDTTLPVFELKISLEHIEPPVWRRIQTGDCSLADLHEIIQSCMGWDDDHMHAFEVGDEQYADFNRGADPHDFRNSQSIGLRNLVQRRCHHFVYEYDFGDSWRHLIEIETTLPAEENVLYPRCVDGARACPPEDCGGSYGYEDLLAALANPDNEEHADRLEWIGDDFDPERFSLDAVNGELRQLRRWLGLHPRPQMPAAHFAKNDRVQVKRGVVHSEYPDIPLGGWVGTVTGVTWLIPVSYEIRWTEQTLAAAHPVYLKRCQRDDARPRLHWLDEGQVEAVSAEQPAEMEQPANLVTKPLSTDSQGDRIRMVFGLTSNDPLPRWDLETDGQYREFLAAHLTFPFDATYWPNPLVDSPEGESVEVVGRVPPSHFNIARGVICEVRREQETIQVRLADLTVDDENPNYQYVSDYEYWLEEVQDDYKYADEADGDEDDLNYADDEEYYDEEEEDEEYGPRLSGYLDDNQGPQPIRCEKERVGRNDLCPCRSGKKYKKCCLNKQDDVFKD
jgi:hypothetical protein